MLVPVCKRRAIPSKRLNNRMNYRIWCFKHKKYSLNIICYFTRFVSLFHGFELWMNNYEQLLNLFLYKLFWYICDKSGTKFLTMNETLSNQVVWVNMWWPNFIISQMPFQSHKLRILLWTCNNALDENIFEIIYIFKRQRKIKPQ